MLDTARLFIAADVLEIELLKKILSKSINISLAK